MALATLMSTSTTLKRAGGGGGGSPARPPRPASATPSPTPSSASTTATALTPTQLRRVRVKAERGVVSLTAHDAASETAVRVQLDCKHRAADAKRDGERFLAHCEASGLALVPGGCNVRLTGAKGYVKQDHRQTVVAAEICDARDGLPRVCAVTVFEGALFVLVPATASARVGEAAPAFAAQKLIPSGSASRTFDHVLRDKSLTREGVEAYICEAERARDRVVMGGAVAQEEEEEEEAASADADVESAGESVAVPDDFDFGGIDMDEDVASMPMPLALTATASTPAAVADALAFLQRQLPEVGALPAHALHELLGLVGPAPMVGGGGGVAADAFDDVDVDVAMDEGEGDDLVRDLELDAGADDMIMAFERGVSIATVPPTVFDGIPVLHQHHAPPLPREDGVVKAARL